METPVRILIAAASEISRQGLLRVLAASPDFVVAGSTAGARSLALIEELQPEIVLLESDSPNDQLLSFLKEITGSPSQIAGIALISDPSWVWTSKLFRSGARSVLSRDSRGFEIIAALRAVAAGLVVLQPEALDSMMVKPAPQRLPPVYHEPLTHRERQVLEMIAGGLGNKEIASKLEISGHTVKFHINSIFTKLNVSSRTEAVTTGLRLGLILL